MIHICSKKRIRNIFSVVNWKP